MDGAQRRLTTFAAKAASPVGYASKIASLTTGMVSGPVGVATAAASTIGGLLDPISAHLIDPHKYQEAMDRSVDRTKDLVREAKRLDFEPQFLRALRMAAGPDAEAVEKGVLKLTRTLGEAKMGGELSELAGNRGAAGKFTRWGLDPDALSKMSNEGVLRAVADRYREIGDRGMQAAMGFDLMGKGASAFHNVLSKGSAGIDTWLTKIKELGVYSGEQIALLDELVKLRKEHDLKVEAAEQNAMGRYGLHQKQMELLRLDNPITSSKYWEGVSGGFGNWFNRTFTGEAMPGEGVGGAIAKANVAELNKKLQADLSATARAEQSAADAAQVLTEEFEKQAESILGLSDAQKVAQASAMAGQTPEWRKQMAKGLESKERAPILKDLQALNKSLEEQIELWGKTGESAKLYRAELRGLAPELQKEVRDRMGALERLRLGDETKTPLEKFQDEAQKLSDLFEGLEATDRNKELFGRGLGKLARGIMGNDAGFKMSPAALAGSTEAANIINRGIMEQRGANRDPIDQLQKTLEKLRAESAEIRRIDKELLDAVQQNGIGILTGAGVQ